MTTRVLPMPRDRASSAAENLPGPIACTMPGPASPCRDHSGPVAQRANVAASPCADQASCDTQSSTVGAQINGSQRRSDAPHAAAAVDLLFCAAFLGDVEGLRKATNNRLRAMAETGLDASPYRRQADALAAIEHQAILALQRAVRRCPLGPHIKRTKGIGDKQGARLIAAIGDIAYSHAEDRPRRGPAELWAYCGYAPGQRRRKGVQSNWNAEAKVRAYLCAESAVQAGVRKLAGYDDSEGYDVAHRKAITPLGAEYLKARANWSTRDTSEAHKQAHALRVVAKAILRDLFLEARRVGA